MKENSDTIRKADISDVEEIMSVMDSARDYQRELGFRQWEDGYPNREVIGKDIEGGNAYVMVSDDRIVAYWALIVGDSSYDMLRNVWRHSGPYTECRHTFRNMS